MATWQQFIEVLGAALGADNVEGGAGDTKAVATVDVATTAEDGTDRTRRQKVHFEYDGEHTSWIAATSFIASVDEPTKVSSFLEYLGSQAGRPGAVIVDGHMGLRNHFSLSTFADAAGTPATDKKILEIALLSAVLVGTVADRLEEIGTKEDVH